MLKKAALFLYLLICLTIPFSLKANTAMTDSIKTLPKGVSIYQLDNGMKVLLIENPALPMTGVNVIIKVGSAYENFSTSGMSHMLEHLLFNGTASRTQKQLYDDVDLIGGYNNASTTEFYTNFMMVTPAENIVKGMEIQADMLFNSTLPDEKFKKEKGIVLEEISKSLADPREQLERNALSILYKGHALSLPTLGTYSTIEGMSRDDVNAFYKNNYVPNNMILTAIGNFSTPSMLAQIKEIYGKAKPGLVMRENNPDWLMGFEELKSDPDSDGKVYHRFYDGTGTMLQLFYKIPAGSSSEYSHFLGMVIDKNKDALNDALKSKFGEAVKSLELSVRNTPVLSFLQASINIGAGADMNSITDFVSQSLSKITFNIPASAVDAEAVKSKTEFLQNVEKPHMFGIYNSYSMVVNGIESVLSAFNRDEFFKAAKELEALKIDSQPIAIVEIPSVKKESGTAENLKILKSFVDPETGRTLIVRQNEASDLLAVHYLVKHKAAYEAKYGKHAAEILHDCLGQRLNSDENLKLSSRLGFSFTVNDNPYIPMDNIYLHPDFGYIRAEGLADDLSGAIGYLNSRMQNFIPTEEEFNKAVEKFKGISMMSMGGDKAKKIFDAEYDKLIYQPNPFSEANATLTYDNMLAFAKEYFNPANMIISVVSPADPEKVNSLFAGFKGSHIENEPAVYSPALRIHDKPETVEKAGGSERAYLFWGFTVNIDPKDAPALQALSLILSDNIVFDIREKQGMAYSMSAGINVDNDKAMFFINQGTRPQNVEKLLPQYPGFFTLKAIDTVTQNTLQKAVNMYLGKMMFRRLSSINQAFYLGISLYFHNDVGYDSRFLEDLKNVKLEDLKAAAGK